MDRATAFVLLESVSTMALVLAWAAAPAAVMRREKGLDGLVAARNDPSEQMTTKTDHH